MSNAEINRLEKQRHDELVNRLDRINGHLETLLMTKPPVSQPAEDKSVMFAEVIVTLCDHADYWEKCSKDALWSDETRDFICKRAAAYRAAIRRLQGQQ